LPNIIKSFLINIKKEEKEYIIINKNNYNNYKRAIYFSISIELTKEVINTKEETLIFILKENYNIGR
jgi:hypothetical protein